MQVSWQGVFPAATTQFNDDESLNIEGTMRHLDVMIENGIHGLVMLGTVGENCSLEYHEKLELLKATVDHVAGRVPVLTGVAEYTTSLACRFANDAASAGVDGLMVLPAMVYNSDLRESVTHFRAVASACGLPQMIYNNPVSYRVDLLPESFSELASCQNIVAIKESSEDPRRITDLYRLFEERFILFCGVDDLAFESACLGAKGWISGLVNAFPAENAQLWDLLSNGKLVEARAIYRWYTPLLHLDTKPKLVQYIKLALQEVGYGSELCRAPRLNLEGAERAEILQVIRSAIASRPAITAAT